MLRNNIWSYALGKVSKKNGPIHPENSRLKFFIIGGVRSNFRADSLILF